MLSMGPCAEAAGLTTATTWGVAVLQLPLMIVVMLHWAPVKTDLFATSVHTVIDPLGNQTAVDLSQPTELHYMHSVPISAVFLPCSAGMPLFTVISVYISDKDLGTEDYVSSNTDLVTDPTVTMWTNIFVGVVTAFHALLAMIVNSPTSIHFLLLIVLLMYVSVSVIVNPRLHYESASQGTAGRVASTYLLATSAYALGMLYILTNISIDPSSYKVQLVVAVGFLDTVLLIFGHTWDPVPNMQTILNSRLIYTLSLVAVNVLVYVFWHPCFRVPYIRSGGTP